ncbi:MAG: response regulator [Labilibaculum sp.]|nr:response regulator [Labilibaculum sp.]MBI9059943.1 response regulator [Labilibaculum sp.]
MSKVKILVVEDEIIIADNICNILENLGYEVLEPAINYTEAIETIENEKPDLAILDIQLAGKKDGVDLAWTIKEDYDIPFIFLTSNADPATIEKAKKADPPAYLVKPFNKDDLYTSIEIALYNFNKNNKGSKEENVIVKDALFFKSKNVFLKIKFTDILFLKSDHVYVEIYNTKGKYLVHRGSISSLIEKLPDNFYRTHRSYVINLDFLESINNQTVVIEGVEIPIGKNYRNDLINRINIG